MSKLYLLYSGSPLSNKDSIFTEGLRAGTWLSRKARRAALFGGLVFKLRLRREEIGWNKEPGDYILTSTVTPDRLLLYREFKSDEDAFEWGDSGWSSFLDDENEYFNFGIEKFW